jgi:hypothetical protein
MLLFARPPLVLRLRRIQRNQSNPSFTLFIAWESAMRLICLALLFLGTATGSMAQGEAPHQAWMKFLVGEWDYQWASEKGGFEEAGSFEIESEANGSSLEVEIQTAAGDSEREIIGWQADRGILLVAGFSSNGSYWHIEYDDITAESMSGSGYGVLPDKRPWKSKFVLKRMSDNEYELRGNGIADGKPLVTVGKMTRQLQAIPEAASKALNRFVGRWKSESWVNGESIGESTGQRKWLPGKSAILMMMDDPDKENEIASGISGWDAKENQLVENWYGTSGLSVEIRYPLAQMNDANWKGNLTVTYGDGEQHDGQCTIKFTDNGWVFIATWQEDDEKMIRKGVTQRQD